MNFQKDQILDRARGVLLGAAVGDALGAGYEFYPPLSDEAPIDFKSSGEFAIGQYTDDTSQMVAIGMAAIRSNLSESLDEVAKEFKHWYDTDGAGIGIQTRAIFNQVVDFSRAEQLIQQAELFVDTHEKAAGNGSLMRTGIVALPFLSSGETIGSVASQVSALTHADIDCREACIIWSKAIRHAILFENFDGVQLAINDLEPHRQGYWNEIFDQADRASKPADFPNNGWVIHALQAAYKAILITDSNSAESFKLGIEAAVRSGNDTDTIAAIAGALLGARWGYSSIPREWLEQVHGWPDFREKDLVELADRITEPIWG